MPTTDDLPTFSHQLYKINLLPSPNNLISLPHTFLPALEADPDKLPHQNSMSLYKSLVREAMFNLSSP
jgi:hypothetical protein